MTSLEVGDGGPIFVQVEILKPKDVFVSKFIMGFVYILAFLSEYISISFFLRLYHFCHLLLSFKTLKTYHVYEENNSGKGKVNATHAKAIRVHPSKILAIKHFAPSVTLLLGLIKSMIKARKVTLIQKMSVLHSSDTVNTASESPINFVEVNVSSAIFHTLHVQHPGSATDVIVGLRVSVRLAIPAK